MCPSWTRQPKSCRQPSRRSRWKNNRGWRSAFGNRRRPIPKRLCWQHYASIMRFQQAKSVSSRPAMWTSNTQGCWWRADRRSTCWQRTCGCWNSSCASAYICRKVQAFSGQTPTRLRITCLAALSARYGPQYLVEAFGLSLTQASRYGKMQEFLLEEEVKQQREAFLELSRRL